MKRYKFASSGCSTLYFVPKGVQPVEAKRFALAGLRTWSPTSCNIRRCRFRLGQKHKKGFVQQPSSQAWKISSRPKISLSNGTKKCPFALVASCWGQATNRTKESFCPQNIWFTAVYVAYSVDPEFACVLDKQTKLFTIVCYLAFITPQISTILAAFRRWF